MWDDLGDYVKKTVAAHHGCIKEHYAVLEQAATDRHPPSADGRAGDRRPRREQGSRGARPPAL